MNKHVFKEIAAGFIGILNMVCWIITGAIVMRYYNVPIPENKFVILIIVVFLSKIAHWVGRTIVSGIDYELFVAKTRLARRKRK